MAPPPKRIALAALGIVCVGLAFAGAVLQGLPTTIFLIAASYLFARSCPWLEERLIRVRWFRPYLPYLDGSRPMPRRARAIPSASRPQTKSPPANPLLSGLP